VYFAQEEGPLLVATATSWCPRWAPFVMTGLLAGLRWGESAALRRSDIDWTRSTLTIARTVSDKVQRIEPCKDHQIRQVKASPALLAALRRHLEGMTLEGHVRGWGLETRALVFPTTYGNILHYPYFLTRVWRPLLGRPALSPLSRHAPHLRHVAPDRRRGPSVGAVATGARQRRTDRRHLRTRPARPA
jgi:integrase